MKRQIFDPEKFNLQQSHFEHFSLLHGINHTYRVMCHVLMLGKKTEWDRETRLAFCAAFIHDMSRMHDGYCTKHGFWSARDKLPVFTEFFQSQGVNLYEIEEIRVAVKNHSECFELNRDHAAWRTTALLKDADALDRVRLGENNLDPAYLRLKSSAELIPFARYLYSKSENQQIVFFNDMLRLAESLPDEN